MAIDQIFSRMDGYVATLVAELRAANKERNALRLGMQTIIDLHAGGEAEEIARQMLDEFVENVPVPTLSRGEIESLLYGELVCLSG